MDAKSLLDQLLQSANGMVTKGRDLAEDKLGIPDEGPGREAKLSGIKTGAVAAGALALLLGTGAGRRLTGTALKLGSLAAIGTVGYKAYQNWQSKQTKSNSSQSQPSEGGPIWDLTGDTNDAETQDKSLVLIKAMIAASNADGHIDYREREQIENKIEALGMETDASALIRAQLENPLDAAGVAALSDSVESATEIYLVTRMLTDQNNAKERDYLDQLTTALGLPADFVGELESELA